MPNLTTRDELVESHFGRALALARRWARGNDGLREDLEDVVIDGLFRAAEGFDPARGVLFWTYAERALSSLMSRFLNRRGREIALDLCDDASSVEFDLTALREQDVRRVAACALAQVGLMHPVATAALLGEVTMLEAARVSRMNYDVLRRRMQRLPETRAAQALWRYTQDTAV